MVVIKQEENEETVVPQPPNPPSKGTPDTILGDSTSSVPSSSANENGNESDAFETASERDVSDDEDDVNIQTRNTSTTEDQPQQQQQHPLPEEAVSVVSNDDKLSEKALEEANEAKLQGNKLFGEGKYEEALLQYDAALEAAPEGPASVELRSICHSNRAVCFSKLGKYEDTVKECTKALDLNSSYVKALVRRGEAHEKLENFEGAIADMRKIVELDPSNEQAKRAIRRLEPLAAEKREKMKEEMIGKLKDMGNSILGRFNMSVDNFKAVKDPNTGSYSISFQG